MKYNNIILDEYKAIFFCVAKGGNTSVKVALKTMMGQTGEFELYATHKGWKHISPCGAMEKSGYRKIAVVRNPWARLVSCYYDKVVEEGRSGLRGLGARKDMSFEDFVTLVHSIPDGQEAHICSQSYGMLCGGVYVPEMTIKLENIDTEWAKVQKLFKGLPDLCWKHQIAHPPYRECYTDETRRMTAERYAEDIERFGYGF